MIDIAFIEIGNICNLACSFCPGTKREPRQMTREEFCIVLDKLYGKVGMLMLHVMGEPLLHPLLGEFLTLASDRGFKVCITTNGTLLESRGDTILNNCDAVHRVSISLHAPEGNAKEEMLDRYLDSAIRFGKALSAKSKTVVYRLWNLDSDEGSGKNSMNGDVLEKLHSEYSGEWQKRYSGYRIGSYAFLEFDGVFTWPSESEAEGVDVGTCRGLRSQIGILADGTVVPCCLDCEGNIPLGNIFRETIEDIYSKERTKNILDGFRTHKMTEPLCQKCTYARRFIK